MTCMTNAGIQRSGSTTASELADACDQSRREPGGRVRPRPPDDVEGAYLTSYLHTVAWARPRQPASHWGCGLRGLDARRPACPSRRKPRDSDRARAPHVTASNFRRRDARETVARQRARPLPGSSGPLPSCEGLWNCILLADPGNPIRRLFSTGRGVC